MIQKLWLNPSSPLRPQTVVITDIIMFNRLAKCLIQTTGIRRHHSITLPVVCFLEQLHDQSNFNIPKSMMRRYIVFNYKTMETVSTLWTWVDTASRLGDMQRDSGGCLQHLVDTCKTARLWGGWERPKLWARVSWPLSAPASSTDVNMCGHVGYLIWAFHHKINFKK